VNKFLVLASLIASTVFANTGIPQNEITKSQSNDFLELRSDDTFVYSNYYRVNVSNESNTIDLLNFVKINETFPLPAEPYKREKHYGGWLRDTSNCLNTRAKVLMRDSKSTVSFNPNGCTVEKGEWNDPYTGRLHVLAKDIQIDHLVALKNSYQTGGHEWDSAKRCLYANYKGNKFHLLSVNGPENLKKGDVTPSQYVPPNKAYTCEYLKNWLSVKVIWNLRITPKEGDAIQRIAVESKCDRSFMQMSAELLAEQQRYIESNKDLCGGVIPTNDPVPKPVEPVPSPTEPPTKPTSKPTISVNPTLPFIKPDPDIIP
jgi:hypothetical protein